MKQLNDLFALNKRLNSIASDLALEYKPDFRYLEIDADFIHFNIESRNTHKLSMRLSDSRIVNEGNQLEAKGRSLDEVEASISQELRDHAVFIALNKHARETNSLLFNGKLVVVENIDAHEFLKRDAKFCLYRADGNFSTWYGYSAENALGNAYPWVKDQDLVMISLEVESIEPQQTKGA